VLNQFVSPRAVAVITRLASLVTIAFIAALLIVMAAVLGHALGGSLFAYVVALAIVGSLSILVSFVLATRSQSATDISANDTLPPTVIRERQFPYRWHDASAQEQQGDNRPYN
jgi:hypothetical protein